MNEHIRQDPGDIWGIPKATPSRLGAEELDAWRTTRDLVCNAGREDKATRAGMARSIGLIASTFGEWLDGTYRGVYAGISEKAERWLRARADQASHAAANVNAMAPGFVETPTARDVLNLLTYAQMMPEMAIITLGPGMGKTTTVRHYATTRPHVHVVTMHPGLSRRAPLLREIAAVLGCTVARTESFERIIGTRLQRNGRQPMLIVDEAQNLNEESVNTLRHFFDVNDCAVALVGNQAVFNRYGQAPRDGFGQVHSRFGSKLHRLKPLAGDVETILDAWGIEDPEQRKLLASIAHKPGALRHVDKTIRLAQVLAAGDRALLTAAHIKAAWRNRTEETL